MQKKCQKVSWLHIKAKKMFNQFNIFNTDKDPVGLDDTISAFIKNLKS